MSCFVTNSMEQFIFKLYTIILSIKKKNQIETNKKGLWVKSVIMTI